MIERERWPVEDVAEPLRHAERRVAAAEHLAAVARLLSESPDPAEAAQRITDSLLDLLHGSYRWLRDELVGFRVDITERKRAEATRLLAEVGGP